MRSVWLHAAISCELAAVSYQRGSSQLAGPAFRNQLNEGTRLSISRRHFVGLGAAAAAGFTLDPEARAEVLGRALVRNGSAAPPIVISSANGIRGVAKAYDMITRENADTLD